MEPTESAKPKKPPFQETVNQLQAVVDAAALKQFWECTPGELILMTAFLASRSRLDVAARTDHPIPNDVRQPIDFVKWPVGAKMWYYMNGMDISVCELKKFNPKTDPIMSQKYPEAQEHLLGRSTTIDYYQELLESGVQLPPCMGYQDAAGNVYLIDGNRRFLAAKRAEGVQEILIWTELLDVDGMTKPLTVLVNEALKAGEPVPAEILKLVKAGTYGAPRPEFRTVFSYKEKRRNLYPAVGDQLDAILKALSGDDTELKTLVAKIAEVKGKFGKPTNKKKKKLRG
jgi:hypothetical protein